MKKIILATVLTFSLQLIAFNLIAKGPGSSSGIILVQPISPEATGMAEACSSMSGKTFVMNYNPAGLAALRGLEFSTIYQKGLSDDTLTAIILGKNLLNAVLGVSVIYYTTGKIDLYDATGALIRKVGQKDIVVIVGSAKKFENFSAGLNLKFISSEIFENNAIAFAVDIGGQYEISCDINNSINTGLCIQNIGTTLTYLKAREKLPLLVRPAVSWNHKEARSDFTVSVDLPYYINEQELIMSVGAVASFERQLSIRAGYKINLTNSKNIDEKLNFGWGICISKFQFNHSIGITGKLIIPQRFSISTKF